MNDEQKRAAVREMAARHKRLVEADERGWLDLGAVAEVIGRAHAGMSHDDASYVRPRGPNLGWEHGERRPVTAEMVAFLLDRYEAGLESGRVQARIAEREQSAGVDDGARSYWGPLPCNGDTAAE